MLNLRVDFWGIIGCFIEGIQFVYCVKKRKDNARMSILA